MRVSGIEPLKPPICKNGALPAELNSHIKQNISRANYLLSAATLVSWSAEPHRIRLPSVIVSGSHLNKKHQATYLANIPNFSVILTGG